MTRIKIGKKPIGHGHPCYVIAEIGSNFDGKLSKAKRLIKLAKECGADCAKFQTFKTEKIISKRGFEKKSTFQSKWKKPVWDVYKEAEFPRQWISELSKYSKKIGIDFFSTPYDFEAVDLLEKFKVPAYKIGSGDITFLELLKYVARKNKPILLATGASTLQEVKNAISTIKSCKNNKIILLQSITQYPSPIHDANIRAMIELKNKFQCDVGYSDHTPGIIVPITSVALGACIIEKHFTDNKKNQGPDHPHSLNPKEFSEMVSQIRTVELVLGNPTKKVVKSEKETRIIQRRSIFTTKSIQKGEMFTKNNVECLRPFIGIPASDFSKILRKHAKRNLEPFTPILKSDFY